jgi:hypothetical protein
MASAQATLDQPMAEASGAIRRWAASNGMALDEATSDYRVLRFKKSASAFSWGSTITVQLQEQAADQTHLTVSTKEVFALWDWGRGERLARRLFEAIGARAEQ